MPTTLHPRVLAALVSFLAVLAAATADTSPAAAERTWPTGPPMSVEGLPADLRLNEIQTVGTHNSFHVQPPQGLINLVSRFYEDARQLEYSHLPLAEQFETQDVRQIELDVFADSEGGRFARPRLGRLSGDNPRRHPEMHDPGFKVLHLNDIDFKTTCHTFVGCLTEVEAWSDANPGHVPIMVLVELHDRDDVRSQMPDGLVRFLGPAEIEPVTEEQMDALEAEIRSVFGRRDLVTPDMVRGRHATVNEAIAGDGWPTLGQTAGRVLFALDNAGAASNHYRSGHPDLAGRAMFAHGIGFRKMNDSSTAAITTAVESGFMVRARADSMTSREPAARTGDTTRRDGVLAAGAHWVSTDWPAQGLTDRFGTDYSVSLPGGGPARCNPVSAPVGCAGVGNAPPVNDAFAGAVVLRGAQGFVDGTNEAATSEPGEPSHAGRRGGASVWYRWTAPADGRARVDTAGSVIDTLLAVYTLSGQGEFVEVASSDDRAVDRTSRLGFRASAGTSYWIAVDGDRGATGDVALRWRIGP